MIRSTTSALVGVGDAVDGGLAMGRGAAVGGGVVDGGVVVDGVGGLLVDARRIDLGGDLELLSGMDHTGQRQPIGRQQVIEGDTVLVGRCRTGNRRTAPCTCRCRPRSSPSAAGIVNRCPGWITLVSGQTIGRQQVTEGDTVLVGDTEQVIAGLHRVRAAAGRGDHRRSGDRQPLAGMDHTGQR